MFDNFGHKRSFQNFDIYLNFFQMFKKIQNLFHKKAAERVSQFFDTYIPAEALGFQDETILLCHSSKISD